MLDRRDFDEWWAREEARLQGRQNIGADYRHWAEAGFMAAATLMAQAMRTQKHIERDRAVSTSGYIRTVPRLLKGKP